MEAWRKEQNNGMGCGCRRLHRLLTLAAVPLLAGIMAEGASLDALLTKPELWDQPAETVFSEQGDWRMAWTAEGRLARSAHRQLQLFELRVLEMTLAFENDSPSEALLYLHSRGDAGVMSADAFRTLLQACAGHLDTWAGQSGGPPAQQRGPNNMTLSQRIWSRPPMVATLEYSVSRGSGSDSFLGEFVRLRIRKEDGAGASTAWLQAHTTTRPPVINALMLRENVERRDNGDVLIKNVPMVDQGPRGYCVAAVSERVLKYYGREFDQHQFAQLAGTTSDGGTDTDAMVRGLRSVASNMTLNFRSLHDYTDYNSFVRIMRDYNRIASRAGQRELPISNQIDSGMVFHMMESAILNEASQSRGPDYRRFLDQVKDHTQRGIPLIWTVYLGKFAEEPALHMQMAGGHLRLIIGYNDKTEQIIFSDTWGAGHEEKRIGQKEAWAMTTGVFTLLPRNIR